MIPASVTARIIPTNMFGQPSIELLPGKGDAAPLADGAVIPGDRSQSTLQLQTAINNLQRLITAVEPSKLNATLTNVRRALDGRGERIGGVIDRLDHYLGSLNDHSDAFRELIASTATDCGDARRSRTSAATHDEPVLGGTAGPVGSARELAQIGELLGTDSADSAALGSLLLGPLVRGTTVVIHR